MALTASWWLAYYPLPWPHFYKEWTFGIALVAASLTVMRPAREDWSWSEPLVIAAIALAGVAILQAMTGDGLWPQAMLMLGYLGFFLLAWCTGRAATRLDGDRVLRIVLITLSIAALGSCFFAALQLNWIEFDVPLVAPRSVRLTSNLAQANHFADLLWIGIVAAIWLWATGALTASVAALSVLVLHAFGYFTGSRTILVYLALSIGVGALLRWRGAAPEIRRVGLGLIAAVMAFGVVTGSLALSSADNVFSLGSTANRATATEPVAIRWWLWKMAAQAVTNHPLAGVGIGRYVGHTVDMSMAAPLDLRAARAESNAHNLILHLAAEMGLPAALVVAVCLVWWLFRELRRGLHDVRALAGVLIGGVILCHAMLEYPLWYLYFLGTFGLVAGLSSRDGSNRSRAQSSRGQLWPAAAMLVVIVGAYAQFQGLESAMRRLTLQVGLGAAPQPDPALEASLGTVPDWSPYRDYAEAIRLIVALPDASNAENLSKRCDSAIRFAPSGYLLARCATAQQVAGHNERATYFANVLCRLFPNGDRLLIESLVFVERTSPAVERLVSTCVQRTP